MTPSSSSGPEPPDQHRPWVVPLGVALGGLFATVVLVCIFTTTRQPVGLYLCRDDLSTCGRLLWLEGIEECRAAAKPYRLHPSPDASLVCIRQKAFESEEGP